MAVPDLPEAVGDASGSADPSTPVGATAAGVTGGIRRSGQRTRPMALPEQASGAEAWKKGAGGGLGPDEGPKDARPPSEAASPGLTRPYAAGIDDDDEGTPRQLHPLPRGLVELYGLLAVLFVLVPEWMAGGALLGFQEARRGSELPPPSGAWKRVPELRLASLNLAELRQLAHERRLIGYSRQSRQQLTTELLRSLKARP